MSYHFTKKVQNAFLNSARQPAHPSARQSSFCSTRPSTRGSARQSSRCFTRSSAGVLLFVLLFSLLFSLLLSSCTQPVQAKVRTTFALDTVVSVTYYDAKDAEAVEKALSLCADYEKVFSRKDKTAELAQINAHFSAQNSEPVKISDALYDVLKAALSIAEATDGAFDPTLGGVSDLYDFTGAKNVPDEATLKEALSHTGWQKVSLSEDHTVFVSDPELVIDLGGIAKGYIADRMKELLVGEGMTSGIISLGGNILLIGECPVSKNADGSIKTRPFEIGIKKPEAETDSVSTVLKLSDETVVTSGDYQRYFIADDILYHHILDPKTGKPVRNGLHSVSVICSSSMLADAYSTALFVAGPEKAEEFLTQIENVRFLLIGDDFQPVMIGDDNR